MNRWLFEARPPATFIFVRTIAALQALWIALSRPHLYEVSAWPSPFWVNVSNLARLRFGFVLPVEAEMVLWIALHVALLLVIAGFYPRIACIVAGLLLYHFAPLEDLFNFMRATAVSGWTLPMLALLIIGAAPTPRRSSPPSEDWSWPVAMIRLLVALRIGLPVIAKLSGAGIDWYSATNIRDLANLFGVLWRPQPDFAIAQSTVLCAVLGVATLALESGAFAAPFSRRVRLVIVPVTLAAVALRAAMWGFFFLDFPMLLVFCDFSGYNPKREGSPAPPHREFAAP